MTLLQLLRNCSDSVTILWHCYNFLRNCSASVTYLSHCWYRETTFAQYCDTATTFTQVFRYCYNSVETVLQELCWDIVTTLLRPCYNFSGLVWHCYNFCATVQLVLQYCDTATTFCATVQLVLHIFRTVDTVFCAILWHSYNFYTTIQILLQLCWDRVTTLAD